MKQGHHWLSPYHIIRKGVINTQTRKKHGLNIKWNKAPCIACIYGSGMSTTKLHKPCRISLSVGTTALVQERTLSLFIRTWPKEAETDPLLHPALCCSRHTQRSLLCSQGAKPIGQGTRSCPRFNGTGWKKQLKGTGRASWPRAGQGLSIDFEHNEVQKQLQQAAFSIPFFSSPSLSWYNFLTPVFTFNLILSQRSSSSSEQYKHSRRE